MNKPQKSEIPSLAIALILEASPAPPLNQVPPAWIGGLRIGLGA